MRRLAPLTLIPLLALTAVACGSGDDDPPTAGSTLPPPSTTEPEPTTTIDPERCFDVPAAAIPTTTVPPSTTVAPVGPTLPPDTTVPATTVPTTEPEVAPPGTATEGVDPADYPEGERPEAIRPCELPQGLTVTVLRPGTGPAAAPGDKLYIDYAGIRSEDGTPFDNSYDRGQPFEVTLGQGGVIQGWDQGLVGAQTGALIRLDIPSELAYGDQPQEGGVIQPGDALTFLTEVRVVVPATTVADRPIDVTVDTSVGATEVEAYDVVTGDGPVLEEGQTAIVHAMLVRGDNRVIFQDTYSENAPASIALVPGGTSLPGLVEGLIGAKVGSTRVIVMPYEDAYGPDGVPSLGLPPETDVIVVAEIIGVLP